MQRSSIALSLFLALGTAFAAAPDPVLSNSEDGAQIRCPLDSETLSHAHAEGML
jgi:hypothetical protein